MKAAAALPLLLAALVLAAAGASAAPYAGKIPSAASLSREALLEVQAAVEAATDVRGAPVLTGTLCECLAIESRPHDGETYEVAVTAKCRKHTSFVELHEGYQCDCFGVAVPCVHDGGATLKFKSGHPSVCGGMENVAFPDSPEAESCVHAASGNPLCGGASGVREAKQSTVQRSNTNAEERLMCTSKHYRNPCQDSSVCNTDPVDCEVEIGTWGACSAPCGGGVHSAPLTVVVPPSNGGRACPSPLSVSKKCNEEPCKVDCVVSSFGPWTNCTAACGGGEQTRTREVTRQPDHGGADCPALAETRPCNEQACPAATDCVYSPYSDCSSCSKSCGGGTCTRTRRVLANATHGGRECDLSSLTLTEECNATPCPVPCRVGNWSDWGSCNATCGAGVQSRTRPVLQGPAHGGAACPELEEERACNTHECPVDCEVSSWGAWGECRGDCGPGQRFRHRNVTQAPRGGGAPCPILEEGGECDTGVPCVKNCTLSAWSNWTACKANPPLHCGGGTRTRSRTVLSVPPGMEHANCGTLTETRVCEVSCGINCTWSSWGAWGACSASCGGGIQSRTRSIATHQVLPGLPCEGEAIETRDCGTAECPPVDPPTDGDKPTSPCDCPCGGGGGGKKQTTVVVVAQQQETGSSCDCDCKSAPGVAATKASTTVVYTSGSSGSGGASMQPVRVVTLGKGGGETSSCQNAGSYGCAAQLTGAADALPANTPARHMTAHEAMTQTPEYLDM